MKDMLATVGWLLVLCCGAFFLIVSIGAALWTIRQFLPSPL